MNKIMMIAVLILFSVVTLQAQNVANDTNKRKSTIAVQPVVAKGYYSIYKNAEKLKQSRPLVSINAAQNETTVTVPDKGYYSMNNHHRKIYRSGVSFIAKQQRRPVASKGYYNLKLPATEVVTTKKQETDSLQPQKDSVFAVVE